MQLNEVRSYIREDNDDYGVFHLRLSTRTTEASGLREGQNMFRPFERDSGKLMTGIHYPTFAG